MKITADVLDLFMSKPHVLGHYLGYTDLIELHSDWIRDAWVNPDARAMQAHRNSFKTTAILIVGALWYHLFFNPSATVLFVRKSETDSQRIVDRIREHLESKEVLLLSKHLYRCTSLMTERWSKSSLSTRLKRSKTPEGNFDAKGTTAAVTGAHYDFIFPDDIISLKDRVSHAEREWVKHFVRELKKIVKHEGKIYYSGTPWHKDDAWTILPKPKLYPIGSVPIRGYTPDDLPETIRALREGDTPSMYAANYELKHITDEGRLFLDPDVVPWPVSFKRCQAWVDPAYDGTNTTALALIADGARPCLTGYVWRKNVTELYGTIADILRARGCGTLYVETNADQGLSLRDFRRFWPNVSGIRTTLNKHVKITGYLYKKWRDMVVDEQCQPEFLSQILDYQEGIEPDDAPDAAAALIKVMYGDNAVQSVSKFTLQQLRG